MAAPTTARCARCAGRAFVLAAIAATGCAEHRAPQEPAHRADGRAASVDVSVDLAHNAYGHAVTDLARDHWADLRAGKAVFAATWVPPGAGAAARAARGPSVPIREGLGPQFNAISCQSCHFRDGRGRPLHDPMRVRPDDGERSDPAQLLRLGSAGPAGQLIPDPVYGAQLQDRALAPAVPEGAFAIAWRPVVGFYPDGTLYAIAAPEVAVRELRHGPLAAGTRMSLRIPPSLIGLGLLEAIPEEAITALADPDDDNRDGISGRMNRVRDPEGAAMLGRFGWKASQPSLWLQNATALREDLGVTNPVFHDGAEPPELDADDLERLTRYTRLLQPPARRDAGDAGVQRGEAVFTRIGCAGCHHRDFQTGVVADLPELSHHTIEPFTDLLLHDLGEALADGRPDGQASGREWRTAPLWGLGRLRAVSGEVRLLHDGRARSPAEAILWHGGEAEAARDRFVRASRADRAALLGFLDAL